MEKTNKDESLFEERRSGKDRRSRPTSPLTVSSLAGSRKYYRRKEDRKRYYFVDLYSPLVVTLYLTTLVLSLVDALLTLRLIEAKFGELNPVMDFFLQKGPTPFIIAKWALTSLGLTVLLVLKNVYVWRGRIRTAALLAIFPFLYLVLIAYELIMVMNL